jgi:hypothetical protein
MSDTFAMRSKTDLKGKAVCPAHCATDLTIELVRDAVRQVLPPTRLPSRFSQQLRRGGASRFSTMQLRYTETPETLRAITAGPAEYDSPLWLTRQSYQS